MWILFSFLILLCGFAIGVAVLVTFDFFALRRASREMVTAMGEVKAAAADLANCQ